MNHYFAPNKLSLNGRWDFLPVYEGTPGDAPPERGWEEGAFLVPSMWTKVGHAWRHRGETHFRRGTPPPDAGDVEHFCDAFGYPDRWNGTRTAWLRRTFLVSRTTPENRLLLCCEALGPLADIYLNGRKLATHADPFLPLELDVTDAVQPGENEIAVLIRPYPTHRDRTLIPSGNELTVLLAGIWQDCYLVECGGQFVRETTIRTSTRERTIAASATVTNASDAATNVSVAASIHAWFPGGGTGPAELALEETTLALEAKATGEVAWDRAWPEARWWDPSHPHLYWLVIEVRADGRVVDTYRERFGFREVWVDGPDVYLNDHPVHLASDWGHKAGLWNYTAEWNRKWLGMIRDANMNHSRLHTHPHPRLVLDLADEMGVLITGETAIHGSGNAQAADHPDYWQAARRHLAAFIARDRNRPSVVMWSIENEMRFEREGAALVRAELPRLRRLANELDPTRLAYHEGDSLMWDEREQTLISRHYGRICSGLGWWDQRQPLHSGEMSLHHLNGPNVVIQFLGDEGWSNYQAVSAAASRDALHVIEGGRTAGVCCFGPWNLSALENYRRATEDVALDWPDETAPGIKPRRIPAYCSEFNFWESGPGYTPSPSFGILARAFRPVALIDLSLRTSYYAGRSITRVLHVVNDGPSDLEGEVIARLRDNAGTVVAKKRWPVRVERGRRTAVSWPLCLPSAEGDYHYEAELVAGGASATLDSWDRPLRLRSDRTEPTGLKGPVAVVGSSPSLDRILTDWGFEVVAASGPAEALAAGAEVCLVGPGAISAGQDWTATLRAFLATGGRAILLEQEVGCIPGAELQEKAVSAAFPRMRNHPVLAGIDTADLAWWGDDAYAQLNPDHHVARRLYRKDDGSCLAPVIDSGEGSFGDGDLEYLALLETEVPAGGLLLACQLEIGRRFDEIPAARWLLRNLLIRAFTWTAPVPPAAAVSAVTASADAHACVARARAGETILVEDLGPETVAKWAEATGLPLALADSGGIYQLVRTSADLLLAGISQADLCGVDNWIYGAATAPVPVARHALAPCAGLESLLGTATHSLLREFFVYQGRTEFLRAHTASRFLFEEQPAPAVGLGRVKVGSGQLLFWQFCAGDSERTRCGRAQRLLRRNLGLLAPGDAMAGEAPSGSEGSPGHPRQLWVLAEDLSDEELTDLRQATTRTGDNRLPETVLASRAWRPLECPDGIVRAADCGPGRPILLYTRLRSPKRRFCPDVDLGIPNPDTFTYCDLAGDGRAQMTMDAYDFPVTDLSSGSGSIPDMAMDLGYNQSLLAWWPETPASTLTIRWRNSLMQPETSFGFV